MMTAKRSASLHAELSEHDVVDASIETARTLPSKYYCDSQIYQQSLDKVFACSWQFLADLDQLKVPGQVLSSVYMPGSLSEPLIITRDMDDKLHCLSNVCTHRGAQLVESDCVAKQIRCRYHGRRFSLNGKFEAAPGFEQVENFPCASDDLPELPIQTWGKFVFASLDPAFSFDELFSDVQRRLGWLPLDQFRYSPDHSRDYFVHANWALYCDNYLEGLHVPFVHPKLATLLDPKDYRTELQSLSSLQIGVANNPCDAFDLPETSPEYGQPIAAYYYFLFPNLMLNFYPWGLSINVVLPVGPDKTRIRFLSYVHDESRMGSYSPQDIDQTQREDEAVVELVQKGVRSRLYDKGRYSVRWESAVHHFHVLLAKHLAG